MSAVATAVLEAGDVLGVNLLNAQSGLYSIVTSGTNSPVLVPDSFVSFEYKGEQRISDYPIEGGGFASFDKVAVPGDIKIIASCGGQNVFQTAAQEIDSYLNSVLGTSFGQPMTRAAYLLALENMKVSLDLYDIVTPDFTYVSYNLIHVSYTRTATKGGTVIYAYLGFQEIRETVNAVYSSSGQVNSNSASAASPANMGTLATQSPTVIQQSQIDVSDWS